MITVHLPGDLAAEFHAPSVVELSAGSLSGMLRELDVRHPGIRHWLTEADGSFRQHISVFVGGVRRTTASAAQEELRNGEVVWVLRAVSGG
jgi:sulfur carrier protein ThiS